MGLYLSLKANSFAVVIDAEVIMVSEQVGVARQVF
jgi:hypothetical protein